MKTVVRGGPGNALLFEHDHETLERLNGTNVLVSVGQIYIFDEKENLVLQCNTATNIDIKVDSTGGRVRFSDAAFDLGLLRFLTNTGYAESTNYMALLKPNALTEINIKTTSIAKKCKLLIIGEIRNSCTKDVVGRIRYGFPNCEIKPICLVGMTANGVSNQEVTVNVFPDVFGTTVNIVL